MSNGSGTTSSPVQVRNLDEVADPIAASRVVKMCAASPKIGEMLEDLYIAAQLTLLGRGSCPLSA